MPQNKTHGIAYITSLFIYNFPVLYYFSDRCYFVYLSRIGLHTNLLFLASLFILPDAS